jgi:hypothetical protein
MASWMVVHDCQDLKAVLGIGRGRLETERHQKDLSAAASARFLLRRLEQPRPQPLFTPRLLYPKLADLEAAASGIPADPRDDSVLLVPHENCQPCAVRYTRHA